MIEETGIRPSRLYSADFCDFFYNPGANAVEVLPMFLATVASDSDVRLNPENTEFCWVDLTNAADVVPFLGHRVALREIRHDFVEKPPLPWKIVWQKQPEDSAMPRR